MPYLDWKDRKIAQDVRPHEGRGSELALSIGETERADLIAGLEKVFAEKAPGELRVDLPNRWIVFWKLREGESRFLLAHPNETEWVATIALEAAIGEAVTEKLKGLGSKQLISLGAVAAELSGAVGSVSNVELVLSLL